MALSNRSSLRLNLSSNEFENRKTNHIKSISKQNQRLLNQKPEFIDSKLSLKQQSWYHGQISRLDAENLLKNCSVGTFLVRNLNSEANKVDYSISLRSVKGFIHIKIEKVDDSYTLGIFYNPFKSVPELIEYYSLNKLPIQGIDLNLLFPLKDELL